jgi:hypothetical protein
MRSAPKIPALYRIAALVVALMIGLYLAQFYIAGAKFAGAVANLARMSKGPSQPAEITAAPDLVPVMILAEPKKTAPKQP